MLFISILRGINVGGNKKILMPELKTMYEALGFSDVTTYIQSGNVVFNSRDKFSDQEISSIISQGIVQKFHFEVPVIVRTIEDLQNVLHTNPFPKDKSLLLEKMHVTFLAEQPQDARLETILQFDFLPDKFTVIGKEVYLYCPGGYGETKLSNTFFENKLKVTATTRNWNTVNKLMEIATGK
jgi:uncharacterized protein (DUF1697 family)